MFLNEEAKIIEQAEMFIRVFDSVIKNKPIIMYNHISSSAFDGKNAHMFVEATFSNCGFSFNNLK